VGTVNNVDLWDFDDFVIDNEIGLYLLPVTCVDVVIAKSAEKRNTADADDAY
jgi:hypothetical protein